MRLQILVPLELCKPSGLMVLSGDTNQLGPSTRCPLYPLVFILFFPYIFWLLEINLFICFLYHYYHYHYYYYSLCSDGASLQERLLRLPFYAACRPESVARSKQQEAEHSQQGLYRSMTDLDREQDSSRNTCKINLDALSVATSRSTTSSSSAASAKSRQSGRQMSEDDELPLGVFLYKNYR